MHIALGRLEIDTVVGDRSGESFRDSPERYGRYR
jgi:hypothetical protein